MLITTAHGRPDVMVTVLVGLVAFVMALVVIWRARHEDAVHPEQPEQESLPFRRTLFAALLALGIAWPTTAWAVPLAYCDGPLWYLMVECWFK